MKLSIVKRYKIFFAITITFQAIACSLLLQACSQLHDFAGRIYHLNGIYLMTRSTVFNRAIATCIGCHIAADKA